MIDVKIGFSDRINNFYINYKLNYNKLSNTIYGYTWLTSKKIEIKSRSLILESLINYSDYANYSLNNLKNF